jgi:hypothetical protein
LKYRPRDDRPSAGALLLGSVVAAICGLSAIGLGACALVGLLFLGWPTSHRAYTTFKVTVFVLFGVGVCYAAVLMGIHAWRRHRERSVVENFGNEESAA